jgi:uncharacterized RDD family membrane protein YckC
VTSRPVRFDTVPAQARPFHGQAAGIVTRTAAGVIDLAIVVIGLAAVYLAVAGVWFLRQGADFSFPIVTYAQAYVAGAIALVVYLTVCWSSDGRTYGDRVLGLRVRRIDGRELSAGRAFVRSLLCTAFPLLLAWVIVDPRNRSVQDRIVGTHVVYDWGGSRPAPSSDDAIGMRVHVAPTVAHEADDRDAEAFARIDGER